jgi:hypothetical protein
MASKRKYISTKTAKGRNAKSVLQLERIDPEVVALEQGVRLLANPEDWYADFWPEDETADQFNQAVRKWRHSGNPF